MKKGKLCNVRVCLSIIAAVVLAAGFLGTDGYAAVSDATKASVAALVTAGNWQGIADMAAADPELASNLGDVLAEIAGTMPEQAAAIAAGVASVMPDRAAEIAAAIAAALPDRAAEIAVAVAVAVPGQAEQIADAVAVAVPGQAAEIANAVAEATRAQEQERGGDIHQDQPPYGQ